MRLVESGGGDGVWKKIAVRHSALIRRSIGRVLRDPEEVENAYVSVLARLRDTPPEHFAKQRSLEAWLTVVSTRVAIDRARRLHGRQRDPRGIDALDPVDRRVFELCHREGLDFRQTLERLAAEGHPWSVVELASAFQRVERAMSPDTRRKLESGLRSRQLGQPRRHLDMLDHVHAECLERQREATPELELLRREAQRLQDRLDALVASLEDRDRELIRRYYFEEEEASTIDEAMGFGGARRVHTALERLRRDLRRKLERVRREEDPAF